MSRNVLTENVCALLFLVKYFDIILDTKTPCNTNYAPQAFDAAKFTLSQSFYIECDANVKCFFLEIRKKS